MVEASHAAVFSIAQDAPATASTAGPRLLGDLASVDNLPLYGSWCALSLEHGRFLKPAPQSGAGAEAASSFPMGLLQLKHDHFTRGVAAEVGGEIESLNAVGCASDSCVRPKAVASPPHEGGD